MLPAHQVGESINIFIFDTGILAREPQRKQGPHNAGSESCFGWVNGFVDFIINDSHHLINDKASSNMNVRGGVVHLHTAIQKFEPPLMGSTIDDSDSSPTAHKHKHKHKHKQPLR